MPDLVELKMIPILIMELRGFAKMATDLARELDGLGVEPERIRAAGIHMVRSAIQNCRKDSDFSQEMHLGGDTWYWNFQSMREAVAFAIKLLRTFHQMATKQGLYYLKPSLALGFGDPKFDGERFLDDASIETYRKADGGRAFTLAVVGEAIAEVGRVSGIRLHRHPKFEDQASVRVADWIEASVAASVPAELSVRLPELLLDTDLIYSNSPSEAIANLIRYQEQSQNAFVFGGPAPLNDPLYRDYVKNTLAVLSSSSGLKMTVLSYLPINEAELSYSWLELCRQMSLLYPSKFVFAAFPIPRGQLRPFSYHIYDRNTVHIGLRSYSTLRGTPTLSSSIMFKNRRIAERFELDFLENFRAVGSLSDSIYAQLLAKFKGLGPTEKVRIQGDIREILAG